MYPDQKAFTNAHIIIPADKFADEIKNILRDVLQEFKLSLTPTTYDSPKPDNELLTRKQIAKLLNISLPTLSLRMKEGKIPVCKIGKKFLFDKNAVINSISKLGGGK